MTDGMEVKDVLRDIVFSIRAMLMRFRHSRLALPSKKSAQSLTRSSSTRVQCLCKKNMGSPYGLGILSAPKVITACLISSIMKGCSGDERSILSLCTNKV